jgi:hypothetical protein
MRSNAENSPEALFQSLAEHHGGLADGPPKRAFGSDALKVSGKIFAVLTKGRLLLKLPSERVDTLVTENLADRFSTGAGRPMKEWVTIAPSNAALWMQLSDEARRYVSSLSR